jgi:hypothetical protein
MSSPTDITKKNNYIENSIFKFKPDIILKGDVYGTDYDYKYNINTNKSSQYQEFCVTNIAKINIQKIKSNFSSYLKYTNYDKELLNKDLRKKYLLQLFTNKFVLNKILNDKNNTILVIEPTIESNFKSIQDNEKKISKQYEILKPINEDILRLETKKTSIEKKRQYDDSKKKNEIENTRKNLLKDLDKVKKNKESLLSDLTKSIDMREIIKDDKKKRSELLKLNSKIETTKQAIKEDDKSIASIEKKIKTLESKVEKEKKTSELDNLNRLLQEYIRNKEEILKIIKELDSQNDSLNKLIREKNKAILQHNIKILITEVFPRNSLYYLNSNQLKIINEPSNEKNFNIRIVQPRELPSINIEKLQNEFINKYIADNIKKLYREKLILTGSSKVSPNFTINKEMENTKDYRDLKSQLNKEAFEKFNKDKSKLIEKEKQKLIENYELTLKRDKIEQIKKLIEQKEKETDSNLKQEIEEKINILQKEKEEPSIKFKEKDNLITPIVDLKKGTNIKVSITLEVRIYRQIKSAKEALERVKENVKVSCKNRRNKIKGMLNNAVSRKIFKIEKTPGRYITNFKTKKGGRKIKKKTKRKPITRR